MASPARKTPRLRFGRISASGANYFVTFCTKGRSCGLTNEAFASALSGVLWTMHTPGDIKLLAASIMPDHVHLLFALGERLGVGQAIGKIKALSRRRAGFVWQWQDESFERQVRCGESLEDYAFYIFMNPYRDGLCPLSKRWPWWLCPETGAFQFCTHVEHGRPVPQGWIGLSDEIVCRIVANE